MPSIATTLGQVGLPQPIQILAQKHWDAIIVGGGHNGLTCAAYLARAGQKVLVLEQRNRLGGACTLERPFADQRYVVSPCAYIIGLLDKTVIADLKLEQRGLQIFPCEPYFWSPLTDGNYFAQWSDEEKTLKHLEHIGVGKKDIQGYLAFEQLYYDMRRKLRDGPRDAWRHPAPSREELEALLGHDEWMKHVMFEASIAEVLDHYISDERLKTAFYGAATIGTDAGPYDKGTAQVRLTYYSGDLPGLGTIWGYVKGGMGMVSFAIAEAAQEAGAILASGVTVAQIVPGEGVYLEGGEFIPARVVISNADPKRTVNLLPEDFSTAKPFRERIQNWKMDSGTVKLNAALKRLPKIPSVGEATWPFKSAASISLSVAHGQRAYEDYRQGKANVAYCEVYFQTGFDPSPAPEGKHLVSVLGQYAPYRFAEGDWHSNRPLVRKQILELLGHFMPDLEDCLEFDEVLGPPHIEERVGLTGGHIFQGELSVDQMWEHRLTPQTGIPGLYLCGAATHPAGSVIATNGKNAAEVVLNDLQVRA